MIDERVKLSHARTTSAWSSPLRIRPPAVHEWEWKEIIKPGPSDAPMDPRYNIESEADACVPYGLRPGYSGQASDRLSGLVRRRVVDNRLANHALGSRYSTERALVSLLYLYTSRASTPFGQKACYHAPQYQNSQVIPNHPQPFSPGFASHSLHKPHIRHSGVCSLSRTGAGRYYSRLQHVTP